MTHQQLPEHMLAFPSVFAVGHEYEILVPFDAEVIMWAKVGEHTYYDHCNGILRSNTNMHRVRLPMEVLDREKQYTIVYKKMIERTPYFPTSEPERELTVSFRPVKDDGPINIYGISDAHDLIDQPIAAGQLFGDEIDLLVLGGDIPSHSGDIKNFDAICLLASGVTHGQCPAIFARGNHDTRGIHAEDMPNYIPTLNGKTYYTFRLGCLWGLLLDCGEDKPDTHEAYGGTICFHQFRLEETDFIRQVIANADREYNAPGVKHKLVISHVGFTHIDKPPFDIEKDLYREWTAIIGEHIKPDLLLYGHYHRTEICPPGCAFDHQGQPCTAIIMSKPTIDKEHKDNKKHENHGFQGCGLTLMPDGKTRVIFNDHKGNILGDEIIG